MAKRSGQEGQEEAQDGQEEAQEGQEEGQEGQDEAQEGQEEAPRGPRGGQRGPRGPAVKKPYFLTPLPRQMANSCWGPWKPPSFEQASLQGLQEEGKEAKKTMAA